MKRFLVVVVVAIWCGGAIAAPYQQEAELSPEQFEKMVFQLLNDGKQSTAEKLVTDYVAAHRDNARILFLKAVLIRSRFMIEEAAPVFQQVVRRDPESESGRCALHVLQLDQGKNVDKEFEALRELSEASCKDIFIRWMLAVQCRNYDRNKEGVEHYKKILEKWDPGPVLVHQTYGNLLDELELHGEALVERRKAVAQEPCGWSYQGLASSLRGLKRFKEAAEAFKKAVGYEPDCAKYWSGWAGCLAEEGQFDEAIGKCQKAIALNAEDRWAWWVWAWSLEQQGNLKEALLKCRKCVELDPSADRAKMAIQRLEKALATPGRLGQ